MHPPACSFTGSESLNDISTLKNTTLLMHFYGDSMVLELHSLSRNPLTHSFDSLSPGLRQQHIDDTESPGRRG